MRDFDLGNGVLVVLHGHGDEPSSARAWGRQIAPPSWEVLAPGAPVDSEGVRTWFSTGPRGADEGEVDASVQRLRHIIEGISRQGRPVAIAGFSQGERWHWRSSAVACPCARPSPATASSSTTEFVSSREADTDPGPPVLVLGGIDDEVVPAFLGQDAAAVLAGEGLTVTTEVMSGAHGVTPAMEARASAWLRDVVVNGVKVSIGLPVDRVDAGAELVSGVGITDLAVGFERLGFDAAYVTDHPAPDDRWLAGGGHHALEPTVALTMAAAATRRLLLHTHIYVLGYRNPFLAAKALASLDVVSGGRLILGVAAGYLRPEFASLGYEFDDRMARLDEALELLPRDLGRGRGGGRGVRIHLARG